MRNFSETFVYLLIVVLFATKQRYHDKEPPPTKQTIILLPFNIALWETDVHQI